MQKRQTITTILGSPGPKRRVRFSVRRRAVATAVVLLAMQGGSHALPTGGVQTFGQTAITTNASTMSIVQSTGRAGLDWQTFSIGAGETVRIQQPDSRSILFNRVLGSDPSHLFGSLQANGRVFLSNPKGIIFGPNSFIDVGSLLATTLTLSDESMLGGTFSLTKGLDQPGPLVQDGRIKATGTVALVAPDLTQSGTIEAPRIGLAAAESVRVDLDGEGLVFIKVGTDSLETKLKALGKLQADGGIVDLRAQARAGFTETVLNMDGIVQAKGLGTRDGQIVVDGGTAGVTKVTGTLDASSADGAGGKVTVLGDRIGLYGNAKIDASGSAGGGTVLVGGNYQGKGPERNSEAVYVGADAKLSADATVDGKGGKVIVWSDNSTKFFGEVTARGAGKNDGGFAEVSGKNFLQYAGRADLSSKGGKAGTLLLDPADLEIYTANTNDANVDQTGQDFTPNADGSKLSWETIGAALTTADVMVTTVGAPGTGTGKITIVEPVGGHLPSDTTKTLTLSADTGGISIEANTVIPTNLTLMSGGPVTQTAALEVAGVTTLQTGSYTLNNTGNNFTGAVQINTPGTVSLTGAGVLQAVMASAGSVTLTGVGTAVEVEGSASALKVVSAGTTNFSGATTITNNVEVDSTGAVTQDAALSAAGLRLTGGGAATLMDAGNAIPIIAASDGDGDIRFATSGALSVGTVDSTVGITRTGNVELNANSLSFAQDVAVGNGAILGTGTLELNVATGTVTQSAGADITVTDLLLRGAAAYTLMNAGNDVTRIAATTGAGVIRYTEADSLIVGSVSPLNGDPTVAGITRTGNVELNSTTLTLSQKADVGSATLELNVSSTASQAAAGEITAGNLLLRGAGLYTLTNSGNNVANIAASTGAGTLRFRDSNGLTVNTVTPVNGGADVVGITRTGSVELTSGTLTLTQKVSAGSVLELDVSSGTVTQAAAGEITAGSLLLRGAANYTLTDTGNNVANIAADSGSGVIRYTDSNGLTVNSVTPVDGSAAVVGISRTGSVELTSSTLTLTQKVDVGSANLELDVSSGTVTQGAAGEITAANLLLRGAANYTLTDTGNDVVNIAADSGSGVIRYIDANNLSVNTVSPVDGGANVVGITRTGSVELKSLSTLDLLDKVDVGSATLELSSASSTVAQSADGNIIAGNLLLRGAGGFNLQNSLNNVANIAAETGAGIIQYRDANGLTVNSVSPLDGGSAIAGITRTGGVSLNATTLTLTEKADVSSATLDLDVSSGTVTQGASGVITAGNLLLRGAAGYTLMNASNNVTNIAADTGGGTIRYNDTNALAVNTVTPVNAGADVVGISRTGSVELAAGSLAFTQKADVGANTLELDVSSGTVTQAAAGVITASDLLLRGSAAYTLTNTSNAVTNIAADSGAGAIRYTDSNALVVNTVNPLDGGSAVVGITRTGNVELTATGLTLTQKIDAGAATLELDVSAGTVTQAGDITAGNLLLRGAAGYTLMNAGNNVTNLAADSGAGVIRYNDTNSIVVNSVTPVDGSTAVAGISRTGNVELNATGLTLTQKADVGSATLELDVSAGTVTQGASGAITASDLLLRGAAAYTLTNTSNNVANIAADSGGGAIRYTDSSALTVNTVTPVDGGTAVAGMVRTGSVELTANALTLTQEVDVGTTTVELDVATGTVTQGAAGDITATNLLLRGAAAYTLLNAGNNVANIAADTGAGVIRYNDADTLVVNSVTPVDASTAVPGITRTGNVELTSTGLTLTQKADVSTATLELDVSAGTVTQAAAGIITAGDLLLRGAAAYTLTNTSNNVANIAADSGAGAIRYTDSTALTVNTVTPVDGGAAVAGITRTGNVELTANALTLTQKTDVSTNTIELDVATGTVTQGASGPLTATNLLLRGEAAYTLTNTGNNVANIAADSGSGTIRYHDVDTLTVNSVTPVDASTAVAGIDRTGSVELKATNITLTEKAKVGTTTLELRASTGTVTQAADITAGNLLVRGDAAFELTRVGNNVTTFAADTDGATGGGTVRYADADGFSVDGIAAVSGGTVNGITRTGRVGLNAAGTIALAKDVNVGAANTFTVQVTSGNITQTTGTSITAGELGAIGASASASNVLLGSTSNAAAKVAITASNGNALYGSANSYEIAQVAADTAPVVGTARQVFETGAIGVSAKPSGGTVELNTVAGTVTQTQNVSGENLLLQGNAAYKLVRGTNEVTTLAATTGAGLIQYADATSLAVGSVTAPSDSALKAGITRTGDVNLNAASISVGQAVSASTLRLHATTGNVSQTSTGGITATGLGAISETGTVSLAAATNALGTVSGYAGAGFAVIDTNGYDVGTVTTDTTAVENVGSARQMYGFSGGGGTGVIANIIELNASSGTITQSADLIAGGLILRGNAEFKLTRGTNDVNTLATSTGSGMVRYADVDDLTIGELVAPSDSTTITGITRTGSVALNTGAGLTLTHGANVGAANTLTMQAVTGNIDQTGGTITAGTLGAVSNAGNVTLRSTSNVLGTAAIEATNGNVLLSATPPYAIGLVAADAEPVVGTARTMFTSATGIKANTTTGTIELDSLAGTGPVTQTQPVLAQNLLLRGAGAYTLTLATNDVAKIAVDGPASAGVIRYHDANALSVDTVTDVRNAAAVVGIVRDSNVELKTNTLALTINQQVNVAGRTLELYSDSGTVTQTVANPTNITAENLLLRGNAAFQLTRGTNDVEKIAVETGSGVIRYADADTLTVDAVARVDGSATQNGIARGANVGLNSAGALTLAQGINAGVNTVTLQAQSGNITETGGATVTAGTLGALAASGNVLMGNGNSVGTVALVGGNVLYGSGGGYVIASVGADSTQVENVGGRPMFTGTTGINASGGVIELNTAGGTVTQTEAVTATGLILRGSGAYTLTGSTNDVSNIAADSGAGVIRYTDANALTVNTIGALSGGSVAGINRTGSVELTTQSLNIGARTSVGAATLELDTASGTVLQSADVVAGNLLLRGAAAYDLTRATNDVGKIAADSGGGTIRYADANALAVDAIAAVDGGGTVLGITRTNGVELRSGTLTLTQKANVGAATLELNVAGGTVTQGPAGNITAGGLLLRGAAGYDLTTTANDVARIAADSGGGAIRYTDVNSLAVDAVTVVAGGTAVAGIDRTGNVEINSTGLTINQRASVGSATLELNTSGGLVEQFADIAAGSLLLRGNAAYDLTRGTNDVSTIAATAGSGTIRYADANTLTVGQVTPVATGAAVESGITRSGNVSLNAVGTITLSQNVDVGSTNTVRLQSTTGSVEQTAGTITADALGAVSATGNVLLGSTSNAIDTVAISAAQGNVLIGMNDSYSIGSVAADSTPVANVSPGRPMFSGMDGLSVAGTLELNTVSGTVSQTQAITATNLLLRGGAAYELTLPTNNVVRLAADGASGTIRYVDANALTVDSVTSLSNGVAVNGITRTGDVALRTVAGPLTLAQSVDVAGNTLTLQASGGDITQTGGSITAAELGAVSTGSVRLGQSGNTVATVAIKAQEHVELGTDAGYVIGTVPADGSMFPATSGITATAGVIGLTTSAGEVTQTQDVTGVALVLQGNATYTLTRATNDVDTIAANNASGPIRFADADNLTVGAIAGVTGIRNTGNVALHAGTSLTVAQAVDVGSNTLTLRAANGDITQTAGSITAGQLGAVSATGNVSLPSTGNALGTVAISANGNVTLGESDGFAIGTVAADGTMFASTSGITAPLSSGVVQLNTVGGQVTQTQDVKGASLLLAGNASYELTRASNDVSKLAASAGTGTIRFVDMDDLSVDAVAGVNGITRSGDVAINTREKLTLAQGINVGAKDVRLFAATGGISQTGGAITARNVGAVAASGSVALGQAGNSVDTVALSSTGNVLLQTNKQFDIGTVSADVTSGGTMFGEAKGITANASTGTIELVAGGSGTVTESQKLTARTLLLGGSSGYNLQTTALNEIKEFAARSGGATDGPIQLNALGGDGNFKLVSVPASASPSGVAYGGLERTGNVSVLTPATVTFDGAIVVDAKGTNKVFLIASSAEGRSIADQAALDADVDRFILDSASAIWLPDSLSIARATPEARLEIARTVINQTGTGAISLAGGAKLQVESTKGGSIVLGNLNNDFGGTAFNQGTISVRSNNAIGESASFDASPYLRNPATPDGKYQLSRIEVNGTNINVGEAVRLSADGLTASKIQTTVPSYGQGGTPLTIDVGIEGDLVRLAANRMNTSDNYIIARYRASNDRPLDLQVPGLALRLRADEPEGSYGQLGTPEDEANGIGAGLRVAVGLGEPGTANANKGSGWMVIEPNSATKPVDPALADFQLTRVFLGGPVEKPNLYLFTGNGRYLGKVLSFYNGKPANDDAQRSALLSIAELLEKIRRETLERAVSTENVARDLRESVLVELGVGPAATSGDAAVRIPELCDPTGSALSCK